MKNEKVELGSISRFYSVEYEWDNGDSIFAVVAEMWDENTGSSNIDIVSINVNGVDVVMLKSELPQKKEQELDEEILRVFKEKRR